MSRFKGEDAKRMSDPDSWSDDDIIYLRDRGQLPSDYKLKSDLQPSAPSPVALSDQPNLGDAGIIVDNDPTNPSVSDPDPVFEDEDDIDSMKKPQLQVEARNRGLNDGGSVPELRERIKAFDANTP